jgi:hypothetical protein
MHASIGSELSRERARDLVERERRVRPRRRARHTRYPAPRIPA